MFVDNMYFTWWKIQKVEIYFYWSSVPPQGLKVMSSTPVEAVVIM